MIERAQKDGRTVGAYEVIGEAGRDTTSYTDSTAESGVTYMYRLAAFNVAATNCTRRAAVVTTP